MSKLLYSVLSFVRTLSVLKQDAYHEVRVCKDGQSRVMGYREIRAFAAAVAATLSTRQAACAVNLHCDPDDYDPDENTENSFSSACLIRLTWDRPLNYAGVGLTGIKLTHADRIRDSGCISGEAFGTLDPILAAHDNIEVCTMCGCVNISCGELDKLLSLSGHRLRLSDCRLSVFTAADSLLTELKWCFSRESEFAQLCQCALNRSYMADRYQKITALTQSDREELAALLARTLKAGGAQAKAFPVEDPQAALCCENSINYVIEMSFPVADNALGINELKLIHENCAHDGCRLYKPARMGAFIHDRVAENALITFKCAQGEFVLLHCELAALFTEFGKDKRLLFQDYASLCEKHELETMLKAVNAVICGSEAASDGGENNFCSLSCSDLGTVSSEAQDVSVIGSDDAA